MSHKENVMFKGKMVDADILKKSLEEVLDFLHPGWEENPDMKETPSRVARMYMHFFRDEKEHTLEELEKKVFPTDNDQMVIVRDIECFGMCPHHLLPIIYKTHIGYIPNGKAVGLSKLARLAIAMASYPKLQENVTTEIAGALEKALDPIGVMVVTSGVHGCMRCRGVEQDSDTITSDCRGAFRDKPEARNEFVSLLNLK